MGLTIWPTPGDIDGPAITTDNAIGRWDGTDGHALQNSTVTLSDTGTLAAASGTLTITSPALTTPALGTPASGVVTNLTGTALGALAGGLSLPASPSVDDTYYGSIITGLNNSGGVTQWNTVYLNSSSQWVKADANGSGTYPARGVAVATATTGNAVTVLTYGVFRDDGGTAWTPGGMLYLSGTAGAITQSAPSASGDNVQQIGYALAAHIVFVDFCSTYITLT